VEIASPQELVEFLESLDYTAEAWEEFENPAPDPRVCILVTF
jgi:hypothetical protein